MREPWHSLQRITADDAYRPAVQFPSAVDGSSTQRDQGLLRPTPN